MGILVPLVHKRSFAMDQIATPSLLLQTLGQYQHRPRRSSATRGTHTAQRGTPHWKWDVYCLRTAMRGAIRHAPPTKRSADDVVSFIIDNLGELSRTDVHVLDMAFSSLLRASRMKRKQAQY
jgi:hypothetical protein